MGLRPSLTQHGRLGRQCGDFNSSPLALGIHSGGSSTDSAYAAACPSVHLCGLLVHGVTAARVVALDRASTQAARHVQPAPFFTAGQGASGTSVLLLSSMVYFWVGKESGRRL